MIKRTSLTFTLKQEDYENFKLIADDLIKTKKMFRSQMEIMECFIQFLMKADPRDLARLKLAPTKLEIPK